MTFVNFGEAARLYAENAAIVEVMKAAYQAELRQFFDALAEKTAAKLAPTELNAWIQGGSAYFQLGTGDEGRVMLWYTLVQPQIIAPGKLWLLAASPEATLEQRSRVAAVANSPELKAWCKPVTQGKWQIFGVEVSYGIEGNPVEDGSTAIATVLKAMWATFRTAPYPPQAK